MNEKEYLRKHFFAYPEIQIKAILKQLADETGSDCRFENVGSFEILTNDDEESIGFSVTFLNAIGGLQKEGILRHNAGEIAYSLWLKNLTLKLK